jgi:hypothetical protein
MEEVINPLNTELNPICHLLALLGAHHIFHISGLRVKGGMTNMKCILKKTCTVVVDLIYLVHDSA